MDKREKITLDIKPAVRNSSTQHKSVKTNPISPTSKYNLDELSSNLVANKRFAGKKCIICHEEIQIGQKISLCKECKTPSHIECWSENKGCGVYGCKESAQSIPKNHQETGNIPQNQQHNFESSTLKTRNDNRSSNINSAGFLERVAAYMIDFIILIVPSMILNLFFGFLGGIILGWLYFSILESSEQQATLGKKLMKIVVVDLQGNNITFARATGRYFSKYLSAAILGIGFLMVAFTAKNQGLHDMVAECLVIKK